MAYVISSDTLGLAIGPVSETAKDVHEALRKARQMYETGLVNVSIKDDAGHKIDGEELLACITGKNQSPKTSGRIRSDRHGIHTPTMAALGQKRK
jgi:hypothetical protein